MVSPHAMVSVIHPPPTIYDSVVVATALDRVCFPEDDFPDPRTTGQQYSGPTEPDSNACLCSSVMYSMLSACAICQGATVDR